jgi:K+-dependent Na+/Ca+ exchanger-like protein
MIFGECHCSDTFDCSSDIDAYGGIVIWVAFMIYMFKALGTVCDEYFVPSLEMISEKLQLSNDVAGATFMAAGSSAPELFTSLVATFLIVNEGGVGTIIGSAIFNILVIVGATCCFAGQELKIWWYPLARDCTFYVIAIAELSVVLLDSEVMWYEGLIMAFSYVVYIVFMKFNYRIVQKLGGEPGSCVEDVEDPETSKPEPEPAEKSEKSVEAISEGPWAAAQAATRPEPMANLPKVAPVGNSTTPDYADEENSLHKPQDPQAKVSSKEVLEQETTTTDVVVISKKDLEEQETAETTTTDKSDVVMTSASAESLHNNDKGHLAAPGTDWATRSGPPVLAWDSEQPQHHVCYSLAELKHHTDHKEHGHNHTHKDGEESGAVSSTDCKEVEEAEETEESGRQCPDPLIYIWAAIMPTPEAYWRLFFASIANIAIATYLMVDAVNRCGCNLGIQPLIMGLIFLAAGTSVPDALGSIAVARQGEGDMAVANALGSNVFDILLGLGVPWFISTALLQKRVVFPGAGDSLLEWILILAVILVLFIGCLIVNKWKLNKIMGGVLMGLYVIYVITALVRALTGN